MGDLNVNISSTPYFSFDTMPIVGILLSVLSILYIDFKIFNSKKFLLNKNKNKIFDFLSSFNLKRVESTINSTNLFFTLLFPGSLTFLSYVVVAYFIDERKFKFIGEFTSAILSFIFVSVLLLLFRFFYREVYLKIKKYLSDKLKKVKK